MGRHIQVAVFPRNHKCGLQLGSHSDPLVHARRGTPPYAIDPMFSSRVDWVINQALSRDLATVINVHHYDEMYKDPVEHLPRLVSLWKQIARHYRGYPDRLYFELLNEPFDQLTDERWQAVFSELLRAVRETNPTRMVIVGPAYWNGFSHLEQLRLPEEDRRLIATFYYYSPFQFTHQGASWVSGSDAWKGTTERLCAGARGNGAGL
jgi:endoglucanase